MPCTLSSALRATKSAPGRFVPEGEGVYGAVVMAEYFLLIKTIHLTSVAASFLLYTVRGIWMLSSSPWFDTFWARRLPHINDTILLTAGILMTMILHQYPVTHAWLTAKLVGLLLHIVLGFVAFRAAFGMRMRIVFWLGSLLAFGYVVAVALTRNPLLITV